MASTDAAGPAISALQPADVEAAQALVVEAGWNQVAADWALFTDLGQAYKVSAPDGAIVASAATLPYAGGFGWISMVLVSTAWRRRGLATQLLQRCIAGLQAQGRTPMLDATPAGRAVYRQLGFHDGWAINRWRRSAAPEPPPALGGLAAVRPLRPGELAQVTALDAQAFGAARPALIERLAARRTAWAAVCEGPDGLQGFLLGRNGRHATQLGPLVARDEDVAVALLDHALRSQREPLLVDLLAGHARVAQVLLERGFAIERPYTRMALGPAAAPGDGQRTIAIAGPELG